MTFPEKSRRVRSSRVRCFQDIQGIYTAGDTYYCQFAALHEIQGHIPYNNHYNNKHTATLFSSFFLLLSFLGLLFLPTYIIFLLIFPSTYPFTIIFSYVIFFSIFLLTPFSHSLFFPSSFLSSPLSLVRLFFFVFHLSLYYCPLCSLSSLTVSFSSFMHPTSFFSFSLPPLFCPF